MLLWRLVLMDGQAALARRVRELPRAVRSRDDELGGGGALLHGPVQQLRAWGCPVVEADALAATDIGERRLPPQVPPDGVPAGGQAVRRFQVYDVGATLGRHLVAGERL